MLDQGLLNRFKEAIACLDDRFRGKQLTDDDVDQEVHRWLDGGDKPLDWGNGPAGRLTPDEWFFVSTLYGTMTASGQRTHIRKFFGPLFVETAHRDIRNFAEGMAAFTGLRSPWMARRLCRMATVLREKSMTMSDYVAYLRNLDAAATSDDPTPALDTILRDHQAGEGKTLSVFVRDCVGGNCFPIDSRVQKELNLRDLPVDERLLVRLSLAVGRNPRQIARMFYEAGGEAAAI